MKVSRIGLISKKITNIDEMLPVQDILLQTGQIMQFGSGIYAYGHIPYLVKKNIEIVISKTLTKYGCSELSLPVLQPESIWEKSGRLDKYVADGVMFRTLTEKGNYCLAPTAEEAIVTYASSRLKTYKDLPVTYFQIGPKFRNEIRTRGYLLRGKSFDMMDAYSFGRNQEDLDLEYDNMKKAYIEIFTELGLNTQPVGADSGNIGGNKSEEFMCISPIGEDNVLFDKDTGIAINSELLEREDAKDYLNEVYGIKNIDNLVSTKAVELGHIFQLGNKYSKSMSASFVNCEDKLENYVMGCYGIGVSRTLAMVYENNVIKNDTGKVEGFALPLNLSPYILEIIPKIDDEEKNEVANKVYENLLNKDISLLLDDRNNVSIGAKIKDSKIMGIPYVVVFGNSLNEGKVSIENNKTGIKTDIPIDKFEEYVERLSFNKNSKFKS